MKHKSVAPRAAPSEEIAEVHIRFTKVVEALKGEPGVSHGGSSPQRFGNSALKVNGKIFAMVSSAEIFVVKLPAVRVAELEQSGAGVRFQAGKGRPMKEWFALAPQSRQPWLALAEEALQFVAKGTTS